MGEKSMRGGAGRGQGRRPKSADDRVRSRVMRIPLQLFGIVKRFVLKAKGDSGVIEAVSATLKNPKIHSQHTALLERYGALKARFDALEAQVKRLNEEDRSRVSAAVINEIRRERRLNRQQRW